MAGRAIVSNGVFIMASSISQRGYGMSDPWLCGDFQKLSELTIPSRNDFGYWVGVAVSQWSVIEWCRGCEDCVLDWKWSFNALAFATVVVIRGE